MNITNNPEDRYNMEDHQKEAYLYGGTMAAEYMKSINKSDLAMLTGEEFLTFCECMCKNYHLKHVEITSSQSFL